MGTTAQTLLVIMILLLGATLTIIGVQVFFVLREVRENARKLNAILEDVETVTGSVVTGAQQASELMENLKGTLSLVNVARSVWKIFKSEEGGEGDE